MVLKEIAERYCSRSFSDKKVPDEVLKDILEAARLAPSWVNTQPWHFIVVKDKRNKAMLSQLAHGQPHVEEASAVIVCCGDKNAWEDENFRKTFKPLGFLTVDSRQKERKKPGLKRARRAPQWQKR